MISEQHGHTYFKKLADSFNDSIKMGKFLTHLRLRQFIKKDDLNGKQNYSPVTTLSSLKNLSGPTTTGELCPTHSPSLHTHTHTHTHAHTHTQHAHTHTQTHFCEKNKKKRTMVAGNTFPFLPPLSNPFHRSCLFTLKLIHI